jgi:hypothetical protein
MTTNDDLTARLLATNGDMIAEAIRRRIDSTPTFEMPDRPADRTKNGRRIPRSIRHRAYR